MRQYSRFHVKEICAELMLSMFRYKDEQKVQIKKNASRDCYHKRENQQKDTPHQINKTNQNKNKERKITTTKKMFFFSGCNRTLLCDLSKSRFDRVTKKRKLSSKELKKKERFSKEEFYLLNRCVCGSNLNDNILRLFASQQCSK